MFMNRKPIAEAVTVRMAEWAADAAGIASVRRRVFIQEQGVPEAMEWEAVDPDCTWFVALAEDAVVAVARLTPAGRVGRMAVLPAWRGRGLGSRLLELAIATARQRGSHRLELHAQSHALGFYERLGFRTVGAEFLEAGIPHRRMFLNLEGR